jgi:uncharacterized protein
MNAVFADTSFFVAVLSVRDVHHAAADRFSREFRGPIVTSRWILVEVANYFAASRYRPVAAQFVESVLADPLVECHPSDDASFASGWRLYCDRLDKEWSLTDYISFVIMQQRSIGQALTTDHHFEQAGFGILLK